MPLNIITLVISALALVLSATTVWLTLLRKGKIRMNPPGAIFLGHAADGRPKVFLRSFIYSTSPRGHIIESVYITVQHAKLIRTFDIWLYGESSVVRASGLCVGKDGLVGNHHFLLPEDAARWEFIPGDYEIEVLAFVANMRRPIVLSRVVLPLTEEQAAAMKDFNEGVFFHWSPVSKKYLPYVEMDTASRLTARIKAEATLRI